MVARNMKLNAQQFFFFFSLSTRSGTFIYFTAVSQGVIQETFAKNGAHFLSLSLFLFCFSHTPFYS